MTKNMTEFLTSFADLLEKHEIEISVIENTRGYSTFADGIEISQNSKYDKSNNRIQEMEDVDLSTYPDADEIRKILNTTKE